MYVYMLAAWGRGGMFFVFQSIDQADRTITHRLTHKRRINREGAWKSGPTLYELMPCTGTTKEN